VISRLLRIHAYQLLLRFLPRMQGKVNVTDDVNPTVKGVRLQPHLQKKDEYRDQAF
jgi:hypothetical protein